MVRMEPDLLPLVGGQRPRLLPDPRPRPRRGRDRGPGPRAAARSSPRRPGGTARPRPPPAPRRRAEWPARYGEIRSAKSPIVASARSSASPESICGVPGSREGTPPTADAPRPGVRISRRIPPEAGDRRVDRGPRARARGDGVLLAAEHAAETPRPRRHAAIRSAAGSPRPRRGAAGPCRPSVGEVGEQFRRVGCRPIPSASILATSHVAVRCGRCSRAILGRPRAA